MTLKRAAVLPWALLAILWFAGCGDYYRPVANPTLAPGGDPQLVAHAVVISRDAVDPVNNVGSVTTIDVSGDSLLGVLPIGRNPVFAGLLGTNVKVYISNRGDQSVSNYLPGLPASPATTTNLPAGAQPGFIGSADPATGYVADPGLNAVDVISATLNSFITSIPLAAGANPVALVQSLDKSLVFVVDQGTNDVTLIQTSNNTAALRVSVGINPVWATLSSDGTLLFVVNQGSNSVSVLTTTNPPSVSTITVGAGPSHAFFDGHLKRLYVANTADNSLSIIDDSSGTPTLAKTVSLAGAPCNGSGPVAVTALSDGSRVYVANQDSNNVCVLATTSDTFFRVVSVGTAPNSIAASLDSTKVFVTNAGSGTVSDINTFDDTVAASLSMPPSACATGQSPCPPQTPVQVIITP